MTHYQNITIGVTHGTQWLPIESAPRDGTLIAVGVWVYDDCKRRIPRWSSWVIEADGGEFGCDGEWGDEPTHWMPLPPPPHTQDKGVT